MATKHQVLTEVDLGKTYKVGEVDSQSQATDGLCRECNRRVGEKDEGVQCDECEYWYHLRCSKLTKKSYTILQTVEDFEWRCLVCKKKAKTIREISINLSVDNKRLAKENTLLLERMAILDNKIKGLKEEIKKEVLGDLKLEIVKEVRDSVKEALSFVKEKENRLQRENNLVFYNMKESQKTEGKEREEDDRALCQRIINHCMKGENLRMAKVIRLGKIIQERENNPPRPRPLLVKFESTSDRWNLLKNARNMKDISEDLQRVNIAPDLNKEEREKDKKLRDELKHRRDNGERNLIIRKGEIVERNFHQGRSLVRLVQ